MPTATSQTPLFVRRQKGGMHTVVDVTEHPGNVWFVGSDVSGADDTTGHGKNPDEPFATLDYAIGRCTANNGDTIYVLPSHSETQSTAASLLAVDVAGVSIVGLGSGADRPTLTLSHASAVMTISAANVTVKNLLIVAGIDSVAAPLTISAADCTLDSIEWRDTTDIELVRCFITTAAADRLTVQNCFHNGYTSGNASINFCRLVGVDGATFRNNVYMGNYSTAIIEFHTTACTKFVSIGDVFCDTGTTDLSDNIVDTATGSTWYVEGYDLAYGGGFSGGSGGAVGGDDVGAVSSGVSTLTSICTNTSTAATGASSGVSTNNSILTNTSTAATGASSGVSTNNSILTNTSTAATGASSGVSTNNSILTNTSTAATGASSGVSTLTSIATTTSTAATGASSGVSTNNSILTNTSTAATGASSGVSTLTSIATTTSTAATGSSSGVSTLTSTVTALSTQMSEIYSILASGW